MNLLKKPKLSSAQDVLLETVGKFRDCYVDAIVVTIDDDAITQHINSAAHDDATTAAFTLVPGVYWRVGTIGIAPLFRQEPCEGEPNDEQLFMQHTEIPGKQGWWIVKDPFYSDQAFNETTAYAWIAEHTHSRDFAPIHSEVHIPYWKAEKLNGCRIESLHERAHRLMGDLEAEMNEADDKAASASSSHRDREQGKRPDSKKEPTGWCNKAASLAAAVLRDDWHAARHIAEQIAEHPTGKIVVTSITRRAEQGR